MTPAEFAALSTRFDDLHEDVREIKTQVKETNGRVRKVELQQAWHRGALAALGILSPVVTGTLVYLLTH